MRIEGQVLREWKDRPYKSKNGQEVIPHVITLFEVGQDPLLQMIDYVLRPEEIQHFGTLQGRKVILSVRSFQRVFDSRARLDGQLLIEQATPSGRRS